MNQKNQECKYLADCKYSIRLIKKLKSLDKKNTLDFKVVEKAIYWAKKYHDKQFRKSGHPFYTHPLEVAYMISKYNIKTEVIVTSILHDIIEDTEVTAGMILDEFGWRIAEMVDMLTRDRPDGAKLTIEEILNNICKKDDKDVLLIKLMDRMHNLWTVDSLVEKKRYKVRHQTLKNFLISSVYLRKPAEEESITQIYFKNLKIKEEPQLDTNPPMFLEDSYLISLATGNG